MMQTSKSKRRRATYDDVEMLVAWHADPDVSRYWDDETFTPEEMRDRLDRGRGLGPDIARATARHLLDEEGWTCVTVDPYRWNENAVRAWERAGFVAVSEREPDDEHVHPWVLMEFRG